MTTEGTGRIITRDLIRQAIKLARPSAEAILRYEGATWGPKLVMGFAQAPGVEAEQFSYDVIGSDEEWNSEWGDANEFTRIALAKLAVVLREKSPASVIVATRPWCLEEGEFLYVGGTYCDGIAVVASGAKGWADEAISKIVTSNIVMLAQLEVERRVQAGLKKI